MMLDAPSTPPARIPTSGVPIRFALLGDDRLARLVEGGSERAFATIYERYHQRLYRYCYSILHDCDDAYDALQSTLAVVFAALQRGQRHAPLRPWLFRIAHNEAISLARGRRRAAEVTEALKQCAPTADDRAGGRARLALLVADLRELPARQRGALLMRELSGLSYNEIAIAFEISVGSVKGAIFEARHALDEFEVGRVMLCEDVRRTISYACGRTLRRRRVRAHLRDCTACAAFAAAIPARGADLQALAPTLSPVLAAGLLARLLGSGPGGGGGGGVAAGAAGKTVGASPAAKALVAVAIAVPAGAGVTSVLTPVRHDARPPVAAHTARAMHAGSAAHRRERAIGADSAPGVRRHSHSDVLGVQPTRVIRSDQLRSAGDALDVPAVSGVVHRGADADAPPTYQLAARLARELSLPPRLGRPTQPGAGSSRGGKSGVGGQPNASSGKSGVGGQPNASAGKPSAGGQRGGPPASVPGVSTTADRGSGPLNHTPSTVGSAQNTAKSPPAPNTPISPPGQLPANARGGYL
jgi:RNA polymerase sigma factor (sigma-70 family)